MEDILGTELQQGDVVAVTNRRGSRQWLSFREVVRVEQCGWKDEIYLVSLTNGGARFEKNN